MKCMICKNGNTNPGESVVTFTRNNLVIVFKNVPSEACDNCGEQYIDEETTSSLLKTANDAFDKGVVVDVRDFKAA